jgi:hypothetical protein
MITANLVKRWTPQFVNVSTILVVLLLTFMVLNMKIETAIGILNKEREFLGLGFLELLQDIQKYGKMVYSEKTMEAFERFMVDGRKMFAPVAE